MTYPSGKAVVVYFFFIFDMKTHKTVCHCFKLCAHENKISFYGLLKLI